MVLYPYLTLCSDSSGSGVFTLRSTKKGEPLLLFSGPILDREQHRLALQQSDVDWYLQISPHEFLGPSGGLDDFVNHSCTPNCGVLFADGSICLVALQDIDAGEQLTFDYATTQNDYPNRFRCVCGSDACRGEIGNFDELPGALKRQYHDLGVLAPWLAEAFALRRRTRRRGRERLAVPA